MVSSQYHALTIFTVFIRVQQGLEGPLGEWSRAGVLSARGHHEQGWPRGSSQAQPKVVITRQVHDNEAGLRSSQEVNLQVSRVQGLLGTAQVQAGKAVHGAAGHTEGSSWEGRSTVSAELKTNTRPEQLRKEENTQG